MTPRGFRCKCDMSHLEMRQDTSPQNGTRGTGGPLGPPPRPVVPVQRNGTNGTKAKANPKTPRFRLHLFAEILKCKVTVAVRYANTENDLELAVRHLQDLAGRRHLVQPEIEVSS